MTYTDVNVSLTDGQVKKINSKSAKECGTTISLKPSQIGSGTHKLSLTINQIKHLEDAKKSNRGAQITFSKAAIAHMIKSGGIFPLFAAIPALIAAAAPAIAKAVALGAVGAAGSAAAGAAIKKATGGRIADKSIKKKGKGLRLPGTPHSWYRRGGGLRLGPPRK